MARQTFLAQNYQPFLGVSQIIPPRQSEGVQSAGNPFAQTTLGDLGGPLKAPKSSCSGFPSWAVIVSLSVYTHTAPSTASTTHPPGCSSPGIPTHPVAQLSKTFLGKLKKEHVATGASALVRAQSSKCRPEDKGVAAFRFGRQVSPEPLNYTSWSLS